MRNQIRINNYTQIVRRKKNLKPLVKALLMRRSLALHMLSI